MKFITAFVTAFLAFTAVHAAPVEDAADIAARDSCYSTGYRIGYATGCGAASRGPMGHRDLEAIEARDCYGGPAYMQGFNAGMTKGLSTCRP